VGATIPAQTDPALTELAKTDPAITSEHEPHAEVHFEPHHQHHSRDDDLPDTPDGVIECTNVDVYYGDFRAVSGVDLAFGNNEITALIGPSGCGKSTLLRSLNRMNDRILGSRVTGQVTYHGEDIYGRGVDAIEVRRRIGMVFQSPTRSRSRSMTTSRTARE
jgi:ABC-type glutathione transport system ATPase component